jgi:hypothetical protein
MAISCGATRYLDRTSTNIFTCPLKVAGVQQKMMRNADVAMNVYRKATMDSKLEAHTKSLECAGVGLGKPIRELIL